MARRRRKRARTSTKVCWNTSSSSVHERCTRHCCRLHFQFRITVIDKELEEWRFRMVALAEESETLAGRDAHLREECDTTMKSLVTKAVQYDKDNIDYPKVDKDDVNPSSLCASPHSCRSPSFRSTPHSTRRCTRLPKKKLNCEV